MDSSQSFTILHIFRLCQHDFLKIPVYDSLQSWSIIIHMKTRTVSELNAAYGFTPLPHGLSSAERPSAAAAGFSDPEEPFATTAEFSAAARNHCCAVMVLNLLLLRFPAYCAGFSRSELFKEIHGEIGNGPVLSLRRANRFLQKAQLPGRLIRMSRSQFPGCRAEYHALLLASAPLDWHWVLAIPDSGKNPPAPDAAIPVITGWDPDRPYLWNPEGPSRLLAAWRLDSD